jgi:hypothetical protein
LNHRDSHPQPVADCFGCKGLGLGFQGLKSQSDDPTRNVPVVAEEGVRGGNTIGQHTEHWDGRQDATVFAPNIKLKTKAEIS